MWIDSSLTLYIIVILYHEEKFYGKPQHNNLELSSNHQIH
jgi:hypothetical protein